jgi:putative tryptophan/tyrosine transport system substrate-binding protein
MKGKTAFGILVLILLSFPALVQARVVLVVSSQDPYYLEVAANFKKGFTGAFEEYNLRGLEDEVRRLGKDFENNPPKLVIVIGNIAAKMAKEYCPDAFVVYAAASNAAGLKFNERKVLGVSESPAVPKMVENIKSLFPASNRIGLIYNPQFVNKEVVELQNLSGKQGISIKAIPVTEIKQIPTTLSQLLPNIDLYLMFNDPGVINSDTFPFIFLACFQKKIPIFATNLNMVKNGAIAGLTADSASVGQELARLSNLAAAEKAGKEKIVYPDGRLCLNSKIATASNITFPPQVKDKAILLQ